MGQRMTWSAWLGAPTVLPCSFPLCSQVLLVSSCLIPVSPDRYLGCRENQFPSVMTHWGRRWISLTLFWEQRKVFPVCNLDGRQPAVRHKCHSQPKHQGWTMRRWLGTGQHPDTDCTELTWLNSVYQNEIETKLIDCPNSCPHAPTWYVCFFPFCLYSCLPTWKQ